MTHSHRSHALVALVLAGLAAGGCGGAPETAQEKPLTPVLVAVETAAGAAGDALVLPARVAAREEVTLTARLAARLTALPVREGEAFHRGQALAVFDAGETRAEVEGARAALAAATVARDIARRQEARMDSLIAARVAAQRELEGAQSERRAAEAACAQAQAQLDGLRSGTTLEAPFDGVVVRRHTDPGQTVGPGQPLLDLRSAEAGEIVVTVPESELARLDASPARFQLGDGAWRPAALARVDGMTDWTTRSRTARFRAADGGGLEPGAFGRVQLPPAAGGAHLRTLSVPSSALVVRGGLTGVFVAERGVARLRWLRVGGTNGGRVDVLAGLLPGEAVILSPAGLADGRPVKVAP